MKPFGDQASPQLNINIHELPDVVCSNCGKDLFVEAHFVKRISAIQSPNHRTSIIPVPVLICIGCGVPLNVVDTTTREQFEKKKEKMT